MTLPIEYRVEACNPQAHLFRVTLTIPAPDAAGEILRLPAWIPGSYMIREFAKNIVEIRAQQGSSGIALTKLDKHSWATGKLDAKQALVVEAVIYAWDLSVRCAHLDQSHGFFNGTQLFLQVVGREDQPHRVDIRRPEGADYADWKVATTLPAAGRRSVDKAGFGLRLAPDYATLIDHPVEMGTWTSVKFDAAGVPHEMVITGRVSFDAKRLAADLKKACEAVIAIFGKKPPFARYLFQTMAVGEGYGGLEHRDSTALICSRNDLPALGEKTRSEAYRTFLGLCSHEYFHAWNVKRIKPAAFVPYRLDEENYTQLLWVFEGFTSYYDDLALLRAGLISREEYLGLLAKTVTAVERSAGRLKQSVAESSFDAWTKYYRQDENSPNAIVSYYQKGSLVALGLDLTIRAKTAGKKSLDDVMRHLWQHYGEGSGGVPEGAMPAIIKAATGVDVRRELARWAEGCEDVPLAKLLKPFGVTLERKAGARITGLGIRTRTEGNTLRLAHVLDGGNAQLAGLSAGDELIALNGLRVTAGNLESLVGRASAGDVLEILVFRRDELRRFDVKLDAPRIEECTLALVDKTARVSAGMRDAWLPG
ncbi:PDZ domain-containing protein [Uliginosibacterium sp. 31-16]|uniref:M61 family metallopeptidase n=1 Tax=Uliginosibacterium sp. 31-16 TaxID=3068315 RepID=UPI00273D2D68|nr:PDZ domain-containing protein [Uliginosibacterium sp. 31-16]MDP5237932.1 PDZ domain-containing protein [Uliginosibacterium sp. 31-16]